MQKKILFLALKSLIYMPNNEFN